MNKTVKKWLIAFIAFVLFFVIMDYFFFKISPKPCITSQPDPLLHHSLKPSVLCVDHTKEFKVTYTINQHGLRENDFPKEKPHKIYRMLFLGDSFTFGTGVSLEDTYVKRLERFLNETFDDRSFQTINAGVPAYGLLVEDLYLRSKGIELSPDLVIVNLSMTDFFDERRFSKIAIYDDEGKALRVPPPPQIKRYFPLKFHNFLTNSSFSYNLFLKKQEDLWKLKERLFAKLRGEEVPEHASQEPSFTPGDPDRDTFAITRNIDDQLFFELFDPVAQRLLTIKKFLDERNIPMLIVVIPSALQISADEWQEGRKSMKLEEKLYPDKVFLEVKKFAELHEISLIDPTPVLKEYSSQSPQNKLYFDFDGHFTPTGHEMMAEIILNFLTTTEKLTPFSN